MNIIKSWLRRERGFISGVLLMAGVLTACTYLYGESMRPVKLTLWMCGFFFLFWCVGSLFLYWKKDSALHKTQKELLHSLDSLPQAEDEIEVRYQEILQELYQRCEGLEQTLRERSGEEKDYYTLWVHQIKTPIAAMRLMLQNMEDQTKTAQLSNELFRIEQYVGMALQYVRLQETGADLDIKQCDVYEIVKQVVKQYKTVFIEKKLSIDFEPFSCMAVTDEKWLTFILEQILSNAVKYTTRGGISIQCNEMEATYTIMVQDTGIGIREEDLPRIFEKGFTGYNGHMDKRSTGIGLYLCKKTADMLGIEIRVESVLSVGTTVYLMMQGSSHEQETVIWN